MGRAGATHLAPRFLAALVALASHARKTRAAVSVGALQSLETPMGLAQVQCGSAQCLRRVWRSRMPPPFPGMDPYLEHPGLWLGVHNRLIADLDDELGPRLRPRYFVAVEERVYVAELPDVVGRPDAVVVAVGGQPRPTNGPAPEVSRPVDRSDAQVLVAALPVVDRIRETYLEVRETATGDV